MEVLCAADPADVATVANELGLNASKIVSTGLPLDWHSSPEPLATFPIQQGHNVSDKSTYHFQHPSAPAVPTQIDFAIDVNYMMDVMGAHFGDGEAPRWGIANDEKFSDWDNYLSRDWRREETDSVRKNFPGIILDRLGQYDSSNRVITLFLPSIVRVASQLDRDLTGRAQSCVTALATIVFLHELGHALHHTFNDFSTADTERKEMFAQHFTLTASTYFGGASAAEVFHKLGKRQPSIYREHEKHPTYDWATCRRLFESLPT